MESSVDDRKYSNDTRSLGDCLRDDKIVGWDESHTRLIAPFEDGPLSSLLQTKDICVYQPGQANKIGKVAKTSWDSFSYALQMGHNVWAHINAVQKGNETYDGGVLPAMLVDERFDRVVFRDIVDEIFTAGSRAKAEAAIEKWDKFYLRVVGTRGATGKKTVNAKTSFNAMFDVPQVAEEVDIELDSANLEALEDSINV